MKARVLLAAVALAVAGCGTAQVSSVASGERYDPSSLVGTWTVVPPGHASGPVVRLDYDLTMATPCGELTGQWRADTTGQFLGQLNSYPGRCAASHPDLAPDWLARAVGYRTDGKDRLLVDGAGATTARLRPAKALPRDPRLRKYPASGNFVRPGVAVPASLRPATAEDLVGRWVPRRGDHPTEAFARFASDATWHGSDGCNGQGGRWTVGAGGVFLATGGPQTLIGCDNLDVQSWLMTATRAALDGETLVFLDARGKEVHRLFRVRG